MAKKNIQLKANSRVASRDSTDGKTETRRKKVGRSNDPSQVERLKRLKVPFLDALLGKSFQVLDQGFVRVIDYMGDDSAIVQAARVSYGAGTKRVQSDRGLIRYLMRHHHTTPFEMCEIKFHLRVPMDCWRQWIRHRTANVNEYSTRYSIAIDAAQQTDPTQWRVQSSASRQGSAGFLPSSLGKRLSADEARIQRASRVVYESRLEAGVAREQARKDLPLSTYTEAYWKIDLHNLFHFLNLRMDSHAQEEIRAYASVIAEQVVSKWVPIDWHAFLDYRRDAVHLSRVEVDIVCALASGNSRQALTLASEEGWLTVSDAGTLLPNRERSELEVKLSELGFPIPWKQIS